MRGFFNIVILSSHTERRSLSEVEESRSVVSKSNNVNEMLN